MKNEDVKTHKAKGRRTIIKIFNMIVLFFIVMVLGGDTVGADNGQEITILFTHDIHSYLTPKNNGEVEQYGLSRMAAKIKELQTQNDTSILVDAGDFSMGTLYQTLYAEEAVELVMLGKVGFDATTFGNHEFDYREDGMASMLHSAVDKAEKNDDLNLPTILFSNIDWSKNTTQDNVNLKEAWDEYGVTDHTIIEKNGMKIGLFSIFGESAEEDAPLSGLVFENRIETAKKMVQVLKEEGAELIVCLSHSGTSTKPSDSEDELLAKAVPDIDVIVSGHSHTVLEKPIIYGNTYVISSGCYTHNLGEIQLKENAEGRYDLINYQLYPLTNDIEEDPDIAEELVEYQTDINEKYLSRFGYTYDQVIAHNSVDFITIDDYEVKGLMEEPLANLIADSYRYAVIQAEGENAYPPDITIAAKGMIRERIQPGDVTIKDVFDVCALGIGPDKVPGYPLVSVWATGEEIQTLAEIDVSVSNGGTAQLYPSGASWTYNPERLILNKITGVYINNASGENTPIEKEKLYRVVTPLYCAQMLGSIRKQSMGLLVVEMKDEYGNPIENVEDYIIRDKDTGEEIKEWYALASYLESFDKGESGLAQVPSEYAELQGRKVEEASNDPLDLLKNPNKIAIIIYIIVTVIFVIIVFLAIRIIKTIRKHMK